MEQLPTAWSMASSLSHMDRPRLPDPRHSATPGQHLQAMAAPSALQATTQHQAAWYEHMSLPRSQERITHPGLIVHDHAHSYLPTGSSRGWPVSPVVTVSVLMATSSLLPTEIGFGASAPPSVLWAVDASDQPPRDPLLSAPSATETSASSSTSTSMASSTSSPILTADNITRIVNKRVNSGLAATASAAPARAPPHSFKLKTFSGASKDWLAYDRSLTYTMEIPPFALGIADLKTTAANAVQSSHLRTTINAEISGDAAAHFDSCDDLVSKGFEMVSILCAAYAPPGDEAVFANFNQLFGLDMQYGKELATYMSRICHICNLLLPGVIKLPSILLKNFAVKVLGNGYSPVKKEFSLASSLFTSLDPEGIEIKCATYTSAAADITDEPDTYVSFARKSSGPPAPTPKPTTAPMAGVSTFPPLRPPPGRKIVTLMEKSAMACPLCHNKRHGLTKFGYGLRAIYVIEYNPEKAKTQLKALDLVKGRHAKPGKNPLVSLS